MKIVCIGKNYLGHRKEMGDVGKKWQNKPPIFFIKPDTALTRDANWTIPNFCKQIEYEAELCFLLGKEGVHIKENEASSYFKAFSLGIDFTARDIQSEAKKNGWPWEIAKAFDKSALIGDWKSLSNLDLNLDFHLHVNDKLCQKGSLSQMIYSPSKCLSYVSQFITIKAGDILMTGTPAGVGPVIAGDSLKGYINQELVFKVVIQN